MKTILAAIDFSDVTEAVLDHATALAGAFGAKVYVVHVAAPEPTFVTYAPGPQHERDFRADELRDEHRKIQDLAAAMQAKKIDAEALLVPGETINKLLEEADHLDADIIVMGSHGHGALYELLVGSVTDGILRKAKRPVTIVPATP